MVKKGETSNVKQILVRNIKLYRKKSGLTQEQAAERAEITAKYWQRLELVSQIDLPSLPVLFRVAKVLEVCASKLLEDKDRRSGS